MIGYIKKTLLSMFVLLSISACSSNNLMINEPYNTAKVDCNSGQYCLSKPKPIKDLLKAVGNANKKHYIYDSTCTNFTIPINAHYCFKDIKELNFYIQSNTNFILKRNTSFEIGIKLNNKRISDVIDYINKKEYGKFIVFIDDNLKLKNSKISLKTIKDLKKYISETTPFFLMKISEDEKRVIYALQYKKIPDNLSSVKAVKLELRQALNLIYNSNYSITKKRMLTKQIKLIIKGMNNYENNTN